MRDGKKLPMNAEQLVVGDIVYVKFGDRLPADVRVIEAKGFKVGFISVICHFGITLKACLHTAVNLTNLWFRGFRACSYEPVQPSYSSWDNSSE